MRRRVQGGDDRSDPYRRHCLFMGTLYQSTICPEDEANLQIRLLREFYSGCLLDNRIRLKLEELEKKTVVSQQQEQQEGTTTDVVDS